MNIRKINGSEIIFNDGSKLVFTPASGTEGYTDFNTVRYFIESLGEPPLNFGYSRKRGYHVNYGGNPDVKFSGIDIITTDPGNSGKFIKLIFKDVTIDGVDSGDRCTYLEAYNETVLDVLGPNVMTCQYLDPEGNVLDSVSFLMDR